MVPPPTFRVSAGVTARVVVTSAPSPPTAVCAPPPAPPCSVTDSDGTRRRNDVA